MANTITSKTLYVGEHGGEVLCEQCAGVTLRSSISNAKSNQVRFTGLNGETFWVSSVEDLGMDCEGGC
jgi:hypothetical protein